ncbi:MAG: family 20 glycosylhydrolase [Bacteroidales bacterium]|nr:family 20 glycosylhydrolase [Bacteroidales bacterium]
MKKTFIILSVLLAAAACAPKNVQTINVVPYPNEVQVKPGGFCVAGADVKYDAAADERTKSLIDAFTQQLSLVTGVESAVSETNGEIAFILDAEMPHEAYTLNVTKKGVEVKASGLNGFNYAIQTIKQMLPVEVFGKAAAADKEWTLPCVKINDAPRFGYRGLHMDVSRHFFDMDEVKRYLDIMEVHKLNTLHWHITDDQGWRLEIKKYPRLTEVGAVRKQTLVGHLFDSEVYDGTPYGEGCYFTQDQVREILDYAAGKGITVIPEIDLPGHMLAALAAYPELGCTGGPYDVWGKWGVADDVLCVGKEKTMQFLEDVLTEVCELFPAEYVHIGGDECPKVRWEKCPHCQAKIAELGLKDDDRFQAEHYLQGYVTSRMEKFLAEKGKKLIGWDEILEGELAPNATVMSWRGVAGGLQAVRMGHDAIMTPNTFFYLDYYQSLDKENEPLAIGGYLPVEKCYSYEPTVEGMTEEEKAHILGVQANLWTEYIKTPDQLHYMLLPRLAALAEVQWCQPEVKSWERFLDSADEFCGIYDIMGYRYGDHLFDTRGECVTGNGVSVVLEAQGETPIRYTLDGSEPTVDSPLYTEPVKITESCTLKARSERGGQMSGRTFEKSFTAHKAMGRPVRLVTTTHPNYTFNCPDLLTDGLVGEGPYNSGDFAGWYNQPFEVVVEMDGAEYSEVTLSTIVFKYDWIMNPTSFTVLTSEDGENFTEVAHVDIECVGQMDDANGCQDYTLTFSQTSAKYLKVIAGCCTSLPEWHPGAGHPAFLFVDEVIVK